MNQSKKQKAKAVIDSLATNSYRKNKAMQDTHIPHTNTYNRKQYKDIALTLTSGLFHTVGNTLLFLLCLFGSSVGKSRTSIGAYQLFDDVSVQMRAFKQPTINNALGYLKQQKYIRYQQPKDKRSLEITTEGFKRMQELLPSYKSHRPWNKKVFLITYDIPETQRSVRNTLRTYLHTLGAAMLQYSVWITPYDPRGVLKDYINQYKMTGTIIISDMGKDASIGTEDLPTLIERVYKLQQLNERYRSAIDTFQLSKTPNPQQYAAYLTVLRDDPQLPFELLPSWWLGDKAFRLIQSYIPTMCYCL